MVYLQPGTVTKRKIPYFPIYTPSLCPIAVASHSTSASWLPRSLSFDVLTAAPLWGIQKTSVLFCFGWTLPPPMPLASALSECPTFAPPPQSGHPTEIRMVGRGPIIARLRRCGKGVWILYRNNYRAFISWSFNRYFWTEWIRVT